VDEGGVRVLLVVRLDHGDVLDGVVAPVQAHQQGGGGQLPGTPQHALEKLWGAFLAVLTAGTQLQLQAVALLGQIGRHRRIAVHALVGARDALLLRLGVVEGCDITVQGHQAIAQRRQPGPAALEKFDDGVLHDAPVPCGMGIHALAQNALGGDLVEAERRREELVLSEPIDRFEIALAQTQQRHIAREHVGVTHGVATQRRHARCIQRQVGAFIQRQANETKTRVGGKIRLGFGDDETSQLVTCWVRSGMSIFYSHPLVM